MDYSARKLAKVKDAKHYLAALTNEGRTPTGRVGDDPVRTNEDVCVRNRTDSISANDGALLQAGFILGAL